MNYQKVNNITGWAVFAVSAYTFLSTIEPTASFWDCGEYIATSFKLQVGHPPGAPLFQMIGRIFTLFAGGDVTKAAKMVNIMSALSSAFAVLFLFWSITALAKKLVVSRLNGNEEMGEAKMWAIMGSGIVGALAYNFCDSFWFSAVEGEVYAMSQLCTAAVFWAILKWESVADEPHSERWIVLIAYLFGLSIGVHLLNLLTIPAIVFIYYFKKYKVTQKGFIISLVSSVALLGMVLSVIIPGVINLAGNFELFFVNTFHVPFNTGSIIYFAMMLGMIVLGLVYTHTESPKLFNGLLGLSVLFLVVALASASNSSAMIFRLVLGGGAVALLYFYRQKVAIINTIILCFSMLVIGYSSFVMLVIRSNANTPMNENAPKDAINLLAYLGREQYGDWPIAYGQYYNAQLDAQKPYSDGNPVYMRAPKKNANDRDAYVVADDRQSTIPNYDPSFCTIFPRMWSSQSSHIAQYRNWGNIKKDEMSDGEGHKVPIKPEFSSNLRYFFAYQMNWMYWRYFFWNFSGKQNDVQGHGNPTDGNWITGFKSIDESLLGVKGTLESNKNNKATNAFYFLPVILGLFGCYYQLKNHNKGGFVVLLLFLFTGLAIIVYLNQYPLQPRERDYAYAGSFYAFAIWIGLGVLALFDWVGSRVKVPAKALAWGITAICLLAVPGLMAKDGWDDHDRSQRTTARDLAKDYLDSCAPNAILFTNGDNDTFPLWYVQEVEGYRTDVRVCNLSLLNTDWYINEMKRKAYDSDPMPLSLTEDKYRQGTRDYLPFYDRKVEGYIPVKELIEFASSDDPQSKIQTQGGKDLSYFPTKRMRIPVDSATVLANGVVAKDLANRIVKNIDWTIDKSYVLKNDLVVLDLLAQNNWKRPIYFAVTTGPEAYMGLTDYFQLEGLAYRLVPVKNNQQEQQQYGARVATDLMYNNMMKFSWGGMDKKGTYLDENIVRMCTNLRMQMGTLASALIGEGEKYREAGNMDKANERFTKAQNVLDKCLEVMPDENVRYDATIYSLIVSYYQLGKFEKANPLAKRIFDLFEKNMNFYVGMGSKIAGYGRDVRQSQEIMNRLAYLGHAYKQEDLAKDFDRRCAVFASMLGAPQQRPQMEQAPDGALGEPAQE